MKSKKFSSQILKLFMILFLILGSGLIVLSSYVLGEELWLKSNTGGKIDRSIWFIHPAEDRPAMAIIKDKYYSNESNEEFSLVVHGVGNMSKLERGAIWEKYNNSVQVEILGEIGSIEE